jgi:sulfate adenylyltransferase
MKVKNLCHEGLILRFDEIDNIREKALSYNFIQLKGRQLCDLELILNGAFYPIKGYMTREDYESVVERMRLADGKLWPIPICLDVSDEIARSIEPGEKLILRDEEGFMLALLIVKDIWKPDKRREAICIYGTDDPERHPGVKALFEDFGLWYVGGHIELIAHPQHYDFMELRIGPSEMRERFLQNGWKKVIGFHTEEYIHRPQREMILRAAMDIEEAGILIHPVAVPGNIEDLDHYARLRSYREVIKRFPPNIATLAIIPLAARWAGPREALWQAIVRKNYGCSHFLVSDDQGDPFSLKYKDERFYPLYSAQEMVKEYEEETGIKMVPMKRMVYVEEKARYILEEEVEPQMNVRRISHFDLKEMLENGLEIPDWFSYPEVVEEMRHAYPPRSKQGFTIFITGLPCSGKSTLAKLLMVRFMEMGQRPVTLLDGDVVRKNLSSELTFTREHRNLNIMRIGFVAKEITKNGGIAICAPIAPYEESRKKNRELITKYGGYIEVYLSTPIEVCEKRDIKGLYAKARAGKLKGFTGVDDPYIPPSNPEIIIDTTQVSPEEAAQRVISFLKEMGYIG